MSAAACGGCAILQVITRATRLSTATGHRSRSLVVATERLNLFDRDYYSLCSQFAIAKMASAEPITRRHLQVAMMRWSIALLWLVSEAVFAAGPGYHVVDRIPMTDGWWDYVSFDSVHRRVFVARGNGVFKLEVDSGLMDYRIVLVRKGVRSCRCR